MEEVIKKRLFHCLQAGRGREKREKSDSLLTLSYGSGGMWTEVGASHLEAMLWFSVI